MMTIPASAIKDEVRMLTDVQIETFGQPAPLNQTRQKYFPLRAVPRVEWI
jgi:hypothetical protein